MSTSRTEQTTMQHFPLRWLILDLFEDGVLLEDVTYREANRIAWIRFQTAFAACSASFLIVAGVLALAWGITKYWPLTNTNLHSLGDYIGGSVGSLWSLAGLFLLFIAFLGQQHQISNQERELRLSRKELSDTRKELTLQRKQLEIQNTTNNQVRFENTFFKLLELQNATADSLNYERKGPTIGEGKRVYKGRDSFEAYYSVFSSIFKRRISGGVPEGDNVIKMSSEIFEILRNKHDVNLDRYYKNLFTLCMLVDRDKSISPYLYFNILKSQFSPDEMLLSFYYILQNPISNQFKELAEDNGLWDALDQESLVAPEHASLYKKRAYRATIELRLKTIDEELALAEWSDEEIEYLNTVQAADIEADRLLHPEDEF